MTQTLYLIRHASACAQDNRRRCISQTDLPLDASGIFQAQQLARWLGMRSVRALYASPLLRARQTADILSGGAIPVFIDKRLTEMRVGAWENLPLMKYGCVTPTCTPFAASIWARPRRPAARALWKQAGG